MPRLEYASLGAGGPLWGVPPLGYLPALLFTGGLALLLLAAGASGACWLRCRGRDGR